MKTGMRRRRALAEIAVAVAITSVVALPAGAAVFGGPIVPDACRYSAVRSDPGGCTICHMGELVINLTKFAMFAIAFPVTVLLTAVGGLVLLTSGPSEQWRTTGKKIVTNTLVGLVIVTVAWLAVDTAIKLLTGGKQALSTIGQPWYEFKADCPIK